VQIVRRAATEIALSPFLEEVMRSGRINVRSKTAVEADSPVAETSFATRRLRDFTCVTVCLGHRYLTNDLVAKESLRRERTSAEY